MKDHAAMAGINVAIPKHGITATTLNSKAGEVKAGEVKIFDFLFTFRDLETIRIIYDFYQRRTEKLNIIKSWCLKQTGDKDCRLLLLPLLWL